MATYSGWLAGIDADTLGVVSTADLDMKVAECHKAAISKRSTAEASLASAKSEYANFSKLRDQTLNLAQELRQVAAKILQSSPNPDECPLCHTQFGPGELDKHISVGVDKHLEALGQTLLTQLRGKERWGCAANCCRGRIGWLRKFCERANLAADISLRSALSEVRRMQSRR